MFGLVGVVFGAWRGAVQMGLWLGGEALSLSAFEVGWTVLRQSENEEGFLEEVLEACARNHRSGSFFGRFSTTISNSELAKT